MKLGFDNKRELAIMVLVVLLALWVISRFFTPSGPVVTASKPPATKAPASGATETQVSADRNKRKDVLKFLKPSLDPSLRFDLLKSSEQTAYEGGKRNIFREQMEEVKIPQPISQVVKPTPPIDPGPPPPPPINLKYYGFANKPGEARRVFLSSGDEVFIAEEGQIIQRRYKIIKISASSVEVEDVLNNNKQTIPLTQG
ncbi:MAG TPA: hypothetical protein VMZ25_06780 [Terriglobales bacterium]|nr:hypothetical protein [Terriglobales bacterium]